MKIRQLCSPDPFTLSFCLPGPVDPRLFAPNFRSDGIFEGVVIKQYLMGMNWVSSFCTTRGCGWQKIGAFVNLGSCYLVGIQAAIVFAFVLHIGGKGFWLGIICALIVQVISLMIIVIRTDWDKEAKKATDRVHSSITSESLVS